MSFAVLLAAAACTESSVDLNAPSGVKCNVTTAASFETAPAGGASGTVTITTNRECAWEATTNVPWISWTSTTNGQGNGSVSFRVNPNTDPALRRATLEINDSRITVSQEAASCDFTVNPGTVSIGQAGGSATIGVGARSGCAWTASSSADWITLSGGGGSGNGSIVLTIAPTTAASRSGVVTIAGRTIVVNQGTAACAYTLTPPAQAVGTVGGTLTVAVATTESCAWTAQPTVPWITVASGATGTGAQSVSLNVAANTGPERTGTVTIGGQTFTVTQAALNCSYAIPTGGVDVAARGTDVVVLVTAPGGCTWTAQSSASWLTITSGSSGNGDGEVVLVVSPNTGPARSGATTIAGHAFTVSQAAGCTYSLSSQSQQVAAAGGSVAVTVTAPGGCTWDTQVSASAPWITIGSGGTGSGNGNVSLNVAANTGPARNGTVTIAGQTFTVNQAVGTPACSYSLSAPSQSVGGGAGSASVNVTAPAGCAWSAQVAANTPWLTIASGGSGSGPGTVGLNVAANTGAARSGVVTIAGQTFTVNQAAGAPNCTYSLSAPSQSVGGGAGTASVNVTAPGGCAWTAAVAPNTPWLTIATGANGSGPGTVGLNVAANTGAARSGVVTIAGQTFTVNQAAGAPACTYALSAPAQSVGAGAGTTAVNVTAGAGCAWTAAVAPNTPWLTIASGANGSGPGTVTFNVAANSGAARAGMATIAGQMFTVNQAAGAVACTYSLAPPTQTITALTVTATITLTTGATCASTVADDANWLTLIGPAGGTGSRTLNFAVLPNLGADRVATITVNGQTATITQSRP